MRKKIMAKTKIRDYSDEKLMDEVDKYLSILQHDIAQMPYKVNAVQCDINNFPILWRDLHKHSSRIWKIMKELKTRQLL